MTEATLVYRPLQREQSNLNEIARDFIKDLETIDFKHHEDLRDLALVAYKFAQQSQDFSVLPVIIANVIHQYQEDCNTVLTDFDKVIVGQLTYKMFLEQASREN